MSTINKKPFIQSVIDTLTDVQKTSLVSILDGAETTIFRSYLNLNYPFTTDDKGVSHCVFESKDKVYTGYLLYNNTYCVLVAYDSDIKQRLTILKLDVTIDKYTIVDEYLDINEFRRLLMDVGEHITTGEIDSGDATEGQVLGADGESGSKWIDNPYVLSLTNGDTLTNDQLAKALTNNCVITDGTYIYYKASETETTAVYKTTAIVDGDTTTVKDCEINKSTKLVTFGYDTVASGTSIEIDSELSDESENPVQNKVITETITEMQGDINDLESTKANKDGNYPTMTVGMADNLTPYDESAGDDQDEPFLFQATGTANGTQSDFATGSSALMKEKRGNSVVVNQLVTSKTGITYSTTNVDPNWTTYPLESNIFNASHKYLILFTITSKTANALIRLRYPIIYTLNVGINCVLVEQPDSSNLSVQILSSDGETAQIVCPDDFAKAIDLTQWFGSNDNIPADLLSHPENFYRYYTGSLAYNTGEIINANSRYIKCIGRQQYDGEHDVKVIPNNSYYIYGSATLTYKDKDGNTIDSESKANETFDVPSNCLSIGVNGSGNIGIYIYYEGESGYDQYYPYEVLTNNDTGTETLLSAGNVADSKTPDGTITRNVGSVDLGTLTWEWSSTYGVFYANTNIDNIKNNFVTLCSKYEYKGAYNLLTDKSIGYIFNTKFAIKDTSFNEDALALKTALNGVYAQYELATPTTESGTPYSANLVIDDFGSMEFSGTSGVPQGNLIFYPVDYKAFIDTLYDYTEGTPSDIALKSDVTTEETARASQDTILQNAIGGTLRHCLCVKETLDFDDTDFVDLGTLNWSYGGGRFYTTELSNLVKEANNKGLCTLFDRTTENVANMPNLTFKFDSSKTLNINDASYTDTTTFKSAMKGVLLAYEKAGE